MRTVSLSHFLVLASALLWATAGIAGRLVPEIPAVALGDGRLLMGAMVLILVLGPGRLLGILQHIPRRPLIAASLGMSVFQWSFFAAVADSGAGLATLVTAATAPLWADLLDACLSHSILRPAWWLGAAALLPAVALVGHGTGLSVFGILVGLLGGGAYAVYASATAKIERQYNVDARNTQNAGLAVTTLALAGGGIALLPVAWPHLGTLASPSGVLAIIYLGVPVTALAYGLFVSGLRRVPTGTALALQLVQPLATMVMEKMLPGPQSDGLALVGIGLIVIPMLYRTMNSDSPNRDSAPRKA